MLPCFTVSPTKKAIPITLVTVTDYKKWLTQQSAFVQKWLNSSGFLGEAGTLRLIPDSSGKLTRILCCVSKKEIMWNVGHLPFSLPVGQYALDATEALHNQYSLAWGLGSYQFTRYKKPIRQPAQLILKKHQQKHIENQVRALYLVRDLINTPTEEMGPSEFAKAVLNATQDWTAKVNIKQIIGDQLLKQGFPCIHLVGRASDDSPRLIDLRFGNKKHPKVTLVGKGVCFDSGGLDIKPASAMLLMKKDMGGAAHVLGLAQMIIQAKLPVYLRVLMPVVENVISGNAYRPGDVIRSRLGKTIEIGNTDAEGRVILADALTEAASEHPDLLIDIATLTGAARVALGTELPALFSNQDKLAEDIMSHGIKEQDVVWRLPLFDSYREALNSPIADLTNNPTDGYGGAITAALFLKEFVPDHVPWVHFDLMAWNLKTRPGRPAGGEAMALRALFSYLCGRFKLSSKN